MERHELTLVKHDDSVQTGAYTNISFNALYSISDMTSQLPSNATDLENHCTNDRTSSLEVRRRSHSLRE